MLFDFKNILDATYGAYVVNGAYVGIRSSNGDSTQAPDRDHAIAVIREFLAGRTASVRQNARDASTAVSTIQVFTDSIDTITEKLANMLKLSKKALEPYQSQIRVEQMQKQFRNLAEEINQIANGTEYNFNKPFSGAGETLSFSIGNGTKIDIIARDFRFDADNLDIEKDPQTALSRIREAITKSNEYKTHLDRQAAHLTEVTAAIELKIQGAMSVNMKDFQPELAMPMAEYAASLIQQDKQTPLNAQANLGPNEILKLLKDSD